MQRKSLEKEFTMFMAGVRERNPHEEEFHQAVAEIIQPVIPFVYDHPEYLKGKILERITEPDRIIAFRVTWENDKGEIQMNRGWRVQFNRAIGPYKGGLRFHPTVNQSVLKFLAFEQIFKNSLTGLPMGAGKGGSNFDPKDKSDREVMRFCQAFMTDLARYIGPETDVPAGDIGVGSREIGYLFGQYMRMSNEFEGALTGKGMMFGGSVVRTEATGYGCVYFCRDMLNHHDDTLENKRVVISGSGNVAIFAAEKALQLGAKVLTVSDSDGFVYDADGLDEEKLEFLKVLKFEQRGRVSEFAKKYKSVKFHKGEKPWGIECDIALPCATQNELDASNAAALIEHDVRAVCCGANMPCTAQAVDQFHAHNVLYAPGIASNAGGVAVSGFEQTQNVLRVSWEREDVDAKLRDVMLRIHKQCVEYGRNGDQINYLQGANIAGFKKVADAMLAYGIV